MYTLPVPVPVPVPVPNFQLMPLITNNTCSIEDCGLCGFWFFFPPENGEKGKRKSFRFAILLVFGNLYCNKSAKIESEMYGVEWIRSGME